RTLSASATDDPPNFITTVSKACSSCGAAAMPTMVAAPRPATGLPLVAERVRVVHVVGVPEQPALGAAALGRGDLLHHVRGRVGRGAQAEVLEPRADLRLRRPERRAEVAHRERDGRAWLGVRIAQVVLARA